MHGAFVWARRALNRRKWWFPARAVKLKIFSDYPWPGLIVDGPAMTHDFKLGSWAAKAEGDASYEETNPNYDMETYEHFPGAGQLCPWEESD